MTAIAIAPETLWVKPSITVDTVLGDQPVLNTLHEAVGVDVGFKTLVTLSDGRKIRKGSHKAVAMELARSYGVVCTEARSDALKYFEGFFDALDRFCTQFATLHVSVGRYFPSTRKCSVCGIVHQRIDTTIRAWECGSCHTKHDRDVNAAKNILVEGLRLKKSIRC